MPSLQERDRFVFEVKYAETMFRYVTDAAVMADCMRAFDPDVDANRFAVEVIKVEEDVRAITQTLSFGNVKIRYYKFKDIDTFFDETAYLQSEWWVDAINENIPEDSAVNLESNFLLRDKHALFLTEAIVKAYKTRTVNLENYIGWKIIKYLSYAASTKMFFCHYSPGAPPWMLTVERTIDRCHGYVKLVMPYALLKLQMMGILDDATITFANHVAERIRHTLELSYNASWLDHESAQVIVKRLRSIHQIIGTASTLRTDAALDVYYSHVPAMTHHSSFIEWLIEAHRAVAAHRKRFLRPPSDDSSFSVSRDDWELTGLSVGAFYIIVYHIIYVPGSILMPPFLIPRGPNSFNYGAIGKVIGHELTHAFDREYLDINERGEEQQLVESTRFKRKLGEILDCLIVQANKMTRSAIAGNNSISETFADNAGVEAAYIAYRSMREEDRQGGIASLSPDQAFFAGSCYMFCQKNETFSEHSSYLPHNVRCNQPCINTQEFADAYGCPAGSPMRPSHRCDIHDLSKPPSLRKLR
ncbi:hypothetical protein HPB48_008118 [Haemaphysalis longicornis]|uniref:Peptidase M13 C-terminal domain-containing protein n=1 Tax=Haemaphysalis longicornis TaxID=44386 RepID=A0A9J6FSB2_HAELO|nr:hypothetical protein HPB48_008118 [Haemaphysalis longicornis]